MNLDWDNLDVSITTAGNSQWLLGEAESKTWHNRFIPDNDLWILWEGNCSMLLRNGWTRLNEGAIVWMRPGHTYHVAQDPEHPIGHTYIHFELYDRNGEKFYPDVSQIPERLESFHIPMVQVTGHMIAKMMGLGNTLRRNPQVKIDSYAENDDKRTCSAMLRSLLMTVDYYNVIQNPHHRTENGRGNAIAIKAAMDIDETKNGFVNIAQLARKHGLSRTRFSKVFTDYWSLSPQEYLIKSRISKAQNLLVNSPELSIGEISNLLGYSDHYFFARQFKKNTGLPPGAYRKQHLKEDLVSDL